MDSAFHSIKTWFENSVRMRFAPDAWRATLPAATGEPRAQVPSLLRRLPWEGSEMARPALSFHKQHIRVQRETSKVTQLRREVLSSPAQCSAQQSEEIHPSVHSLLVAPASPSIHHQPPPGCTGHNPSSQALHGSEPSGSGWAGLKIANVPMRLREAE